MTLALGIGANATIFTLVNAILLKNLPVTDPKSLVRIGDAYQCCVNDTAHDGDYGIFSTHTYEQLKKNKPEFEELAAMQAGFRFFNTADYRVTRRTTCPVLPWASSSPETTSPPLVCGPSRTILRRCRQCEGRPVVAVMSYETWKNDYNRDRSVIGNTFWINTKPVTIVGIAPQGFYGDRLSCAASFLSTD